MKHIVLLGDSIFDNQPYVGPGGAVIDQLTGKLMHGDKASLLAVDGSVTADIHRQLENLPADTTHLFISSGGNDALNYAPVLESRCSNISEAFSRFAGIREQFTHQYRQMLSRVTTLGRPVVICTIYEDIPELSGPESSALALFNEIILKQAVMMKLPVIDLRCLCNEAEDYSQISPIEPSGKGANKICGVIRDIVYSYDFSAKQTLVFGA